MEEKDTREYKTGVRKRLESLRPIFARASIGKFDQDVPPYEDEDEFTEMYVGVQMMLEVIRGQLGDMKELNEELERKLVQLRNEDQAKSEFLATLAHELRNPLAPITSTLELIDLQGHTHPSTPASLRSVNMHLKTVTRLLDDLLDVSRISRKKLEIRKEEVELQGIIRQALQTIEPYAEEKRHALEVSLAPAPIVLFADPLRLQQIFVNILFNAAKFTKSGGRIFVRTQADDNKITVSIQDNGIGIPNDMLARIFEPFVQVNTSVDPSRPKAGLGIGLALSKLLIEMHGGSIEAKSAGLGHGSEFLVRLPYPPHSALGA